MGNTASLLYSFASGILRVKCILWQLAGPSHIIMRELTREGIYVLFFSRSKYVFQTFQENTDRWLSFISNALKCWYVFKCVQNGKLEQTSADSIMQQNRESTQLLVCYFWKSQILAVLLDALWCLCKGSIVLCFNDKTINSNELKVNHEPMQGLNTSK